MSMSELILLIGVVLTSTGVILYLLLFLTYGYRKPRNGETHVPRLKNPPPPPPRRKKYFKTTQEVIEFLEQHDSKQITVLDNYVVAETIDTWRSRCITSALLRGLSRVKPCKGDFFVKAKDGEIKLHILRPDREAANQ